MDAAASHRGLDYGSTKDNGYRFEAKEFRLVAFHHRRAKVLRSGPEAHRHRTSGDCSAIDPTVVSQANGTLVLGGIE